MTKTLLSFLLLLLISCNSNHNISNSDFLSKFHEVKENEIIKNVAKPHDNKNNILSSNDYEVLNHFLISMNELEFKETYTPTIKNRYELYYKYQLNKKIYLLSFLEYSGYLSDYTQYLCTYDSEKDIVLSKIVILRPRGRVTITNPTFNGKTLTITQTYNLNLENGLDPQPNDTARVITGKYIINPRYCFEKIEI